MAASDESELIALTVLQLPVVHHYAPAVISAALEKRVTEADEEFEDIKRMAEKSGQGQDTDDKESRLHCIRDSQLCRKGNVDLIAMGTRAEAS